MYHMWLVHQLALNAMSVATKYSCNDIIDLFLNSAVMF